MSLSSMTNVAVRRRSDDLGVGPEGSPPKSLKETTQAASETSGTQNVATAAIKAIVAYIPTEIITLYVAALAAVSASSPASGAPAAIEAETGGTVASTGQLTTFWVFLVITPVVTWLLYAGKVKTADKALPLSPRKWPWWEMVAATIAFAAWAYALPNSVFTRFSWYSTALGTLAVLIVSTVLGLLAPIVQRRLPA